MAVAGKWLKWSLLEGGTKVAKRFTMAYAGLASRSWDGAYTLSLLGGFIILIGGFIGGRKNNANFWASPKVIMGGLVNGVIVTLITVLGAAAFIYPGADAGVITFFSTASIVPGALIDWKFFGRPLSLRQCLGIVVYFLAGMAILDFPSFKELVNLPTWVLIAILLIFIQATNEAVAQSVRKMDTFVINFWSGASTIIFSSIYLSFFGSWSFFANASYPFLAIAAITGLITFGMTTFKLFAYKEHGSIALVKLVVQGTHLVGSVVLGMIILNEVMSLGKVLGMFGFFLAFGMMDAGAWKTIQGLKSRIAA